MVGVLCPLTSHDTRIHDYTCYTPRMTISSLCSILLDDYKGEMWEVGWVGTIEKIYNMHA